YLQPAPALQPYVSTYIFLQSWEAEEVQSVPPHLASGLAFLWGEGTVWHGQVEETLPSSNVIPINDEPFSVKGSPGSRALSVKFRPGQFSAFFGWPQDLFFDQTIPLADTDIGADFQLLHESLNEQPSAQAMGQVLDRFLLDHLPQRPAFRPLMNWVLEQLLQDAGPTQLQQLWPRVKVTERHLRRLFRESTGLSRRQFVRILRFYRAFSLLLSGQYTSQAQLALDAGYFDQAHFVRDFRTYAGQTPTAFLTRHQELAVHLGWEGWREG
ncbi:MAG: AraC family transcriptional regulator, partial [Lewinella sp.]|nr:AraC family transcriptional regulator [Lewinella sp.]